MGSHPTKLDLQSETDATPAPTGDKPAAPSGAESAKGRKARPEFIEEVKALLGAAKAVNELCAGVDNPKPGLWTEAKSKVMERLGADAAKKEKAANDAGAELTALSAASPDAKQKAKGKKDDADAALKAVQDELTKADAAPDASKEICSPDAMAIRAFDDIGYAAAAVADAPKEVREKLASIRKVLRANGMARNTRASDETALARLHDAAESEKQGASTPFDLQSAAVDLVSVGLAGLAKLIEDRARYEAIGWFLGELGDRLCMTTETKDKPSDEEKEKARLGREMSRHVMPGLCALAEKGQLWEYGAGGGLWQSLQTAVRDDLRGLPGAAAGFAMLVFADKPGRFLGCEPTAPACRKLGELRTATSARTLEIIQGKSPTGVLRDWSSDLERSLEPAVPAPTDTEPKGAWYSTGGGVALRVMACAASLPGFTDDHWRDFQALDIVGEVVNRGTSLVLAALESSRACRELLFAAPDPNAAPPAADLQTTASLAGLTELIAGVKSAQREATAIESLVRRFAVALPAFDAAGSASGDASAPALAAPQFQIAAGTDPKAARSAVEAYVDAAAATNTSAGAKIDAVFSLADLALELAQRSLEFAQKLPNAVPTLRGHLQNLDLSALKGASDALGRIRDGFGIARAAVKGDWAGTASKIGAFIEHAADENWFGLVGENTDTKAKFALAARKASDCDAGEDEEAKRTCTFLVHLKASAKDIGALVAAASARDADEMAKALDSLADPPGGWRIKRRAKQDTLSITAHAGFYSALEWRFGRYGAFLERGNAAGGMPYGQAPTVAFPFGLEYAHGLGCSEVEVFLPLIDPVAFLGYDVSNGGRLPGPNPITVLSPGLEVGFGLGNTPFDLGAFVMWRPSYRAWKSETTATGAHALQAGLLLSVDVTLFTLATKGSDE